MYCQGAVPERGAISAATVTADCARTGERLDFVSLELVEAI